MTDSNYTDQELHRLGLEFMDAIERGNMEYVRENAQTLPLLMHARANNTGFTALSIAVSLNDLEITKFLIESGAACMPDKRGRWPTTIAATCKVSEQLNDMIVEYESRLSEEEINDITVQAMLHDLSVDGKFDKSRIINEKVYLRLVEHVKRLDTHVKRLDTRMRLNTADAE